MVKVKPSALGLVSWKLKLVLNCATLSGVAKKALRASNAPPSVRVSELPFNAAPPFRMSPAPLLKPVEKSGTVGSTASTGAL